MIFLLSHHDAGIALKPGQHAIKEGKVDSAVGHLQTIALCKPVRLCHLAMHPWKRILCECLSVQEHTDEDSGCPAKYL